ncbi:MAG: hypothetical protein HY718_01000, partial [Planctomycetes bacterium]|nr:hypothetical protein [Planctomycetota bacterium]
DADSGEAGDWLAVFAQAEHDAGPAGGADRLRDGTTSADGPPVDEAEASGAARAFPTRTRPPEGEAKLLDFADKDDIIAPPARLPPRVRETSRDEIADEDRGGITEATKPYWIELIGSFLFFLDGGSFVTFIIIILVNLWTVPLSFAGLFGLVGLLLISGYLCTFYMTVILETASGEDELPNVWISSVLDDVILSGLRFVGTWIVVLLPAVLFALIEYVNLGTVHWTVVTLMAVVGLFFWPVVILGVAIGGSFHGLWPLRIMRTAAAAPLAYLAMCAVLLIAAGLNAMPHMQFYQDAAKSLAGTTGQSLFWLMMVVNSAISAYSTIVAMRVIGLYYRHYKHKFPWVAE